MAKTFTAQLRGFKNRTTAKMERIVRSAVQDVLEGAQTTAPGVSVGGTLIPGRIPVASSDLANSLTSSVAGGGQSIGSASYTVVLAGYKLGAPMKFAWTMEYAMRIELGFSGQDSLGRNYEQPGWHFVGMNAAKWSEFVALRARLEM